MFQQIDELLARREDQFPQTLLQAREALEKITSDTGSSAQHAGAYTRLAEVLFWLGEYSTAESDKEQYFSAGVEAGKKAVELDDGSAAAHMWYAACMGSHGMVRGIMSSLFYLGPLEKHGKKAMELDEAYYEAGPLRLLGRLYQQAPGWPVGPGDAKKAIDLLEKAVKIGPNFLYNHLYLAEAYLSKSRKEEARQLVSDVLARVDQLPFKMQAEMIRKDAQVLQARL